MKGSFLFLLSFFVLTGLEPALSAEEPPAAELSQLAAAAPEKAKLAGLLDKGFRSYETLKDYKAFFYKRESSNGALPADAEKIFLKFEKPWKIFMKWLNTDKSGLQVVYERGKHDGKLAIHKPGLLLGLAQVVFLDQNSPWVREGSASYDIEDAGIGTFLRDFSKAVLRAHKENKLKVELVPPADAREEAVLVTFENTQQDSDYFAYRVKVGFETLHGLPVRMELYDWQEKPMGVYLYDGLQVDQGPADEEFRSLINRRLLRVYEDSRG